MILSALLILMAFALPLLSGFFITSILERELALRFRILFAIPLGFGIHSIFYFVYQCLNVYNFKNFQIFEVIFVLILAICYYNQERPDLSKHKFHKLNNWFYLANLYGLCMFFKYFINNPMGSWDGLRIWNIKAEFLFQQTPLWQNVFKLPHFMMHSDYPMFLPSSTARLWSWVGEQNFYLNLAFGAVFTFGLVYLLYQTIRYFKSEKIANIVCIVFMISDVVMVNGAAQCADIPLAMFFLSTIVCLFFYSKTKHTSLLVLSILFAGLSVWVKNEGMLFFFVYVTTILGWLLYRKNYKITLLTAILGVAFFALSAFYKKLTGTPNDLVYGLILGKTYKFALEPYRYAVVVSTFLSMLFKKFTLFLALFILCLKGFKLKETIKTPFLLTSIMFLLCVFGYVTIYIIAPHDINWIVENSLERIILQILPIFLVLLSLSLRIGKPDTLN